MPYFGEDLSPLFSPGPLRRVLPDLVDDALNAMQDRVVMNTPVDTGELRESWYTVGPVPARNGWQGWVRTEIDYAPHVEWGTGIYGPSGSPYPIEPKSPGGVLTWVDAKTGDRIFATRVMHPGSPGQHMMAIGAAMLEHEFPIIAEERLQVWKLEQEAAAKEQVPH